MEATQKLTVILSVLGYTPAKIAKSTRISLYRANRLFKENVEITFPEFLAICKLLGVSSANTFFEKLQGRALQ